jgi:hypothetical protein
MADLTDLNTSVAAVGKPGGVHAALTELHAVVPSNLAAAVIAIQTAHKKVVAATYPTQAPRVTPQVPPLAGSAPLGANPAPAGYVPPLGLAPQVVPPPGSYTPPGAQPR